MVPEDYTREKVLKLLDQKDALEKSIGENGQILMTNGNVGMTEPLVDADGFPRNDIDVYQVRHARHRINCLQNDRKSLLKEIEKGLAALHSQYEPINTTSSTKITNMIVDIDQHPEEGNAEPFAWINFCHAESPAYDCGLRVGDEIIEFGSVNANNFRDLMQIADIVKHSEDKCIALKIRRNKERVHYIRLIPKKWSGRGLLGCNINQIERH